MSRPWNAALFFVVFMSPAAGQTPLGTVISFQGQLKEGGMPVSGSYDLAFTLHNDTVPISAVICKDNVNVVNGLLSVQLDFGAGVSLFNGEQRSLELAVRPGDTGDCALSTGFVPLTPRSPVTAAPYALKVPGVDGHSLDAADGSPADVVFANNVGNVGIGTNSPQRKLHVSGDAVLIERAANDAAVLLRNTLNGQINATFGLKSTGLSTGYAYFTDAQQVGTLFLQNGNVGIGATSPTRPLSIRADADGDYFSLRTTGDSERFVLKMDTTTADLLLVRDGGTERVRFGYDEPAVETAGTIKTGVLEITAGSDIAEPFNVNVKSPEAAGVEPGMVVVIDPERVGELQIAHHAYDRTVAGVISGANGIKAGLTLTQAGSDADGKHLVALTGRVWGWCDADAGGAIQAGDLLTTSDTPGHAMKVMNFEKAHGAALGKAMSPLSHGKGLVLILVNLQ